MADLIAYQSGNWTGATTWKGVATSTGAKQGTISGQTTIASSTYSYSPTFTIANGVVIEGILLHLRGLTTAGTFSVALSDNNGVTATREVTVNGADLPTSLSYVFFRFGTTLTGDGGTDYRVGVKNVGSTNAEVSRGGTADWVRYLRTDTTATAAGADVIFVARELTGQGTNNGTITVTMDSTASTAYGECNIGANGVLSYGTAASTNYILDLAGNLNVWGDGTFNIGTSGTRIPSTSTALLEFTNAVNVDRGLEVRAGGTCNMYGATKTTTQTLLTADAASGQKVVTVASTSGWVANDVIALASTTRTASQSEKATISTVDSGTQITTVANLTNTHHGAAPYQGEVVNLTRNVVVRGTSQSLCAYINCAATSNFTASYAEFYWLGSSTSNKDGISSSTSSGGTFSLSYCSIYDPNTSGRSLQITGTTGSPSVTDCVIFQNFAGFVVSQSATSGTPTHERNCIISNAGTVSFSDLGGTIRDNRWAGCIVTFSDQVSVGTVKDNVQHSASTGIIINADGVGTIDGLTVWRNSSVGIDMRGALNLTNCSSYHNATSNIDITTATANQGTSGITISNSSFNGGTGASLAASSNQFRLLNGFYNVFDSCNFGNVNTATNFMVGPSVVRCAEVTFRKCVINDTVAITNQVHLLQTAAFTSAVKFDKFNNTAGSHRAYKRYGQTQSDQSTFRTAAPSEALLPNTASLKLPSGSKRLAVASGTTATVSVYVRKSATYNGNQPRLIVKANSIAGITTDTVLDTMTVGTGTWEQLTGTTATVSDDCVLEVYVDCDGTAGTVNVDDWSVT